MNTIEIEKRYTVLAEDNCCLSCGGAINYAEPKLNEVCVDLGCGRGSDVIRLANQVGEDGYVYGLDVSEGMLRKAMKTAQKLGVNNVKFMKAELEDLPIKEESVNLVISNCTINHASDKDKVWKGIHRILKNGGRFVVSDIYSIDKVPDEFRNDPQAVAECWAGAIQKDEYMAILKKVGFKEINIIEESKPYSKGQIQVSSFTIQGVKDEYSCC